jgi:flagellar basal body-associated protein FliL
MANWSDLEKSQKNAIIVFLVIIVIVLILALYGYFTGAWEKPEGTSDASSNTVFAYQQAGWSAG